ncbi:MAG TPA: hypothetical protein IGS40_07785 [Trichormus sp. M33_DOE_039]|nr:hypothetical protein [Trichormus sp. M33_DOE_039]
MKATESVTSSLVITSSNQNNGILQIPTPAFKNMPENATKVSESWKVVNFKVYSNIKSIPTASLPNYSLEDTETDRLIKSLDVEWNSPRIQLNLYIGTPNNWSIVGSVSLLNASGYPYRIYDLLEIYAAKEQASLGVNVSFGIAIEDVGHGLLSSFDKVSILVDYLREISYFVSPQINITTPEVTVNNPVEINNNINGVVIDENNGTNNGIEDINEMPLLIKNANYNPSVNERILCTSAIELYLPASPSIGDEIEIYAGVDGIITVNATPNTITRVLYNSSPVTANRANIGRNYLGMGGKLIWVGTTWMCNGNEFNYQEYD